MNKVLQPRGLTNANLTQQDSGMQNQQLQQKQAKAMRQ